MPEIVQLGPLTNDVPSARFLIVGPRSGAEALDVARRKLAHLAAEDMSVEPAALDNNWLITVRYGTATGTPIRHPDDFEPTRARPAL